MIDHSSHQNRLIIFQLDGFPGVHPTSRHCPPILKRFKVGGCSRSLILARFIHYFPLGSLSLLERPVSFVYPLICGEAADSELVLSSLFHPFCWWTAAAVLLALLDEGPGGFWVIPEQSHFFIESQSSLPPQYV